jgi:EvpB/VC_A0108, tail sheath N-terminal domain/Type VI secretion system, VipA, VC_A0107 or Hcp2
MKYAVNFGRLAQRPRTASPGKTFRLAVLGDFSGRANEGQLETGATLAGRKPLRVDVDNLDATVQRMGLQLHLPIAADGGAVEIKISSIDDFHPDQLYKQLELFSELSALRRRLRDRSTFDAAAAEVRSWPAAQASTRALIPRAKPRGAAMPHGKLDDFARLLGERTAATRSTTAEELIKQIVGPHIVAAPSPDQESLLAAVDEALTTAMRRVLHHPDFQAIESLWRSIDLLTRELETGTQLQIVLYNITAEEIAADLSASDSLEQTGLYSLLIEQPALDAQGGPLSAIIGNYLFELTPPHAELLGRIGKIAAAAEAPFIAAVSTEALKKLAPEEIHPLVTQSWNTLRAMPHARYLGLTVPRFMLRWPYGHNTEPIESFRFEEFTPNSGLKAMLWANGAMLAGLLLGKTFTEQGMKGMQLGSIMTLGDVPFYYYTDADGDQVALPNTERLMPEATAVHVISQGFMPVLCIRGRNEVRLGSFQSLAGTELAGPWSPVAVEPDEPAADSDVIDRTVEPEVQSVEQFEAQATAEAENELDALLASLQSMPGSAAEPTTADMATEPEPAVETPAAAGEVNELDALLADLQADETPTSTDASQMDPDLAELLASL